MYCEKCQQPVGPGNKNTVPMDDGRQRIFCNACWAALNPDGAIPTLEGAQRPPSRRPAAPPPPRPQAPPVPPRQYGAPPQAPPPPGPAQYGQRPATQSWDRGTSRYMAGARKSNPKMLIIGITAAVFLLIIVVVTIVLLTGGDENGENTPEAKQQAAKAEVTEGLETKKRKLLDRQDELIKQHRDDLNKGYIELKTAYEENPGGARAEESIASVKPSVLTSGIEEEMTTLAADLRALAGEYKSNDIGFAADLMNKYADSIDIVISIRSLTEKNPIDLPSFNKLRGKFKEINEAKDIAKFVKWGGVVDVSLANYFQLRRQLTAIVVAEPITLEWEELYYGDNKDYDRALEVLDGFPEELRTTEVKQWKEIQERITMTESKLTEKPTEKPKAQEWWVFVENGQVSDRRYVMDLEGEGVSGVSEQEGLGVRSGDQHPAYIWTKRKDLKNFEAEIEIYWTGEGAANLVARLSEDRTQLSAFGIPLMYKDRWATIKFRLLEDKAEWAFGEGDYTAVPEGIQIQPNSFKFGVRVEPATEVYIRNLKIKRLYKKD